MSNFFKKVFKLNDKINKQNIDEQARGDFKVNVKGQRVMENSDGVGVNKYNFDNMNKKDKGPPMLSMSTRIKVWGALFGVGVYFCFCYKLIKYRLKADDLDLMEREVNEEYKLKLKIDEFNKSNDSSDSEKKL